LQRADEVTLSRYQLPYGKGFVGFELPDAFDAQVALLAPREAEPAADPRAAVAAALDAAPPGRTQPSGGSGTAEVPPGEDVRRPRRAVIAVNDKTRPVPHAYLLPPLLARLEALGFARENITLLVATGTHAPMPSAEFGAILPPEMLARYPVYSHDCDATGEMVALGATTRGTPVFVNRRWWDADLRLVVGNIEPHQFMGFSGGVKSAAVGVTARATINANHAMMTAPGAEINHYDDNPCRQDVEEIGRMIGVHYALNAVLNDHKQIVHVLAGRPKDVMAAGIPLLRAIYQVRVHDQFDLVLVAPGGHPKDINLYQAQKAFAHATMVTRPGGTVILAAACPDGAGSAAYERWMLEGRFESHQQVLERYAAEGYRIGPHKGWQIARDAVRVRLMFVSDMPVDLAQRLLLNPFPSLQDALDAALFDLRPGARIGIMPFANATIPMLG
jgi:lactate racemase